MTTTESKPEFPADVWRTASDMPLDDTGDMDHDILVAIARGIMAERERCASKWLPIESAPDQKWILGWLEDHGCVVVKRVEPNGRGGEHGDFVWATPESPDAGFWAEQLVTHYQLLPSGPTPPNGDVRG